MRVMMHHDSRAGTHARPAAVAQAYFEPAFGARPFRA